MRKMMIALAAVAVLLPAAAQAMTVAEFLAKASALQAQGVLAVGSSDIALLRGEVQSAGTAYRADLAAQVAAGKKPSSCPPPVGSANVTSQDIIANFNTIPAPQRTRTSVRTAFAAFMTQRYPCKR